MGPQTPSKRYTHRHTCFEYSVLGAPLTQAWAQGSNTEISSLPTAIRNTAASFPSALNRTKRGLLAVPSLWGRELAWVDRVRNWKN